MPVFKTKARTAGTHVYVRLFSSSSPGATYAKLGGVTMTREEYESFTHLFKAEHEPLEGNA